MNAPADTIPRDLQFRRRYFRAQSRRRARRQGRLYRLAAAAIRYGELADRVERFGHALRALGIRREERVLICLLDTIDWPTAFLGALKAGVVAVPVNTLLTEDDYASCWRTAGRGCWCCPKSFIPNSPPRSPRAKTSRMSSSRATTPTGRPALPTCSSPRRPKPFTAPTTRDDMCFWLYTSGSTGKPKGAVHTHADLKLTDDLYARPVLGITENDICYSVAKLFFAYGLGNALTFPMSAGATTVLLPSRPTPDAVAELLKKHQVTVFYAVPTFYAGFLASPAAPERAALKLRCCVSAGEALPPDVGRRWSERYGVDILDGIGSTEMLHIYLSNRTGDVKYGTSGRRCRATTCA